MEEEEVWRRSGSREGHRPKTPLHLRRVPRAGGNLSDGKGPVRGSSSGGSSSRNQPVGAQRLRIFGSLTSLGGMTAGPSMTPVGLLLGALLAVYNGTPPCAGFNIDERFPVVKEGQTKGSFFGLSVALHQQTQGSTKYL